MGKVSLKENQFWSKFKRKTFIHFGNRKKLYYRGSPFPYADFHNRKKKMVTDGLILYQGIQGKEKVIRNRSLRIKGINGRKMQLFK